MRKSNGLKGKFEGDPKTFPLLFLTVVALWILANSLVHLGWVAREDYGIFLAPLVEEAFKATIAYPIIMFLYLRLKGRVGIDWRSLGLWTGLGGGLLVGFFFGAMEGVLQTEPVESIISGVVTHSLLTAGVGAGISSLLLTRKKWPPLAIYPLAVSAHGIGNYDVYHPSTLTQWGAIILTVATILLAASIYCKITGEITPKTKFENKQGRSNIFSLEGENPHKRIIKVLQNL